MYAVEQKRIMDESKSEGKSAQGPAQRQPKTVEVEDALAWLTQERFAERD